MTEQQVAEILAALKRIEDLLTRVANNTARDGTFIVGVQPGANITYVPGATYGPDN